MACGLTKSQEWMSYYTMPYEMFYVNEEKKYLRSRECVLELLDRYFFNIHWYRQIFSVNTG